MLKYTLIVLVAVAAGYVVRPYVERAIAYVKRVIAAIRTAR